MEKYTHILMVLYSKFFHNIFISLNIHLIFLITAYILSYGHCIPYFLFVDISIIASFLYIHISSYASSIIFLDKFEKVKLLDNSIFKDFLKFIFPAMYERDHFSGTSPTLAVSLLMWPTLPKIVKCKLYLDTL